MSAVIVRYRVKPGRAEENAELVRAVYAELAAGQPPGFHYATYALEDGVTFVHVAFMEDGQRHRCRNSPPSSASSARLPSAATSRRR